MFNHHVIANNTNELSVTLEVNLDKYCEACVELYHAEEPLQRAFEQEHPRSDKISEAEYQYEQNKYIKGKINQSTLSTFQTARAEMENTIKDSPFEDVTAEIRNALVALCNQEKYEEHLLAQKLLTNNTPIAELLSNHFIELFKNSIDTTILRYIKKLSSNTILKMNFSIPRPISTDTISLTITDNAGGFPEKYIPEFNDLISALKQSAPDQDNAPKDRRYKSEKAHGNPLKKYCCGGEGAGMIACGKDTADISENSLMLIGNTTNADGTIGAQITFIAPLVTPTTSYKKEKYDTHDSGYVMSNVSSASSTKSTTSPPTTGILPSLSIFASSNTTDKEATKISTQLEGQITKCIKKKIKPPPLRLDIPSTIVCS